MILAVDVDYREHTAKAAGVVVESWCDAEPSSIVISNIRDIADYEPGNFYLREMPCILQLIKENKLEPSIIVIDGFVWLGSESSPGLGMRLFDALKSKVNVVGVAKKAFKDTPKNTEVLRGKSAKPLYVTSAGISLEEAKRNIAQMDGIYRVPTLLKRADTECRKI